MSVLLAYFDPGSGSLILQMLVGGSAGLFVFARYLWDSAPSMWKNRKAEINQAQQG
jgi:hypothetical protein